SRQIPVDKQSKSWPKPEQSQQAYPQAGERCPSRPLAPRSRDHEGRAHSKDWGQECIHTGQEEIASVLRQQQHLDLEYAPWCVLELLPKEQTLGILVQRGRLHGGDAGRRT